MHRLVAEGLSIRETLRDRDLACVHDWAYRTLPALKAGTMPLRTARQCAFVCPVRRLAPPKNCACLQHSDSLSGSSALHV